MLRFIRSTFIQSQKQNRLISQQFSSDFTKKQEDDQQESDYDELTPQQEQAFENWLQDKEVMRIETGEEPIFVPLETLKNHIKEFNSSKQMQVFNKFLISNKGQSADNRVFIDHQQDIKIQISMACNGLRNDQDIDDNLKKIEKFVIQQFQQNIHNFIQQKDFQTILQNIHSQKIIKHFLNKKFYQANPNFINNSEISHIMSKYEKHQEYANSLDLIMYHKEFIQQNHGNPQQFVGFEQAEKFIIKNSKTNQFNYLNFAYFMFKLTQKNIFKNVDQTDLVNQFLKISLNNSQQFDQAHKNLLLLNLKVQFNDSLRYFLFDTFFCANKIEKSYTQYCLTLCVLARLKQKEVKLLDLFPILQVVFYSQFEPYFKKWLPKALDQMKDKTMLRKYEEQLELFQQNKSEPLQIITEFDKQIFQKRSFIYFNYENNLTNPIQLSFIGQKLKNDQEENQSATVSRKENMRKSLLEKDYNLLGLFIQENLSYDQELSKNKIDFDNVQESINTVYQNLKDDVDEMIEFDESTRQYFRDSSLDKYQTLDPIIKQKIQLGNNYFGQVLNEQRLIKKTLTNKSKHGFCSNLFKQFLDDAKKIDQQRQAALNAQQINEIKKDLNIAPQEDVLLDKMLANITSPQEQQDFLENLILKNVNEFQTQQICEHMTKGMNNQFLRLFFQPKIDVPSRKEDPGLQIEKNYNSYIVTNLFDFKLPEACYLSLLKYQESNFQKKNFKKVIAHYLKYSQILNENILKKIIQISQQQKLGETIFDVAKLSKGQSLQSLQIMLPCLARFKDHSNLAFDLVKQYLDRNPLSFEIIQQYTKDLMDLKQPNEFMSLFEKIKIYMLSKKFKSEKELSPEETIQAQNNFKIQNQKELLQFYTDFTTFLNNQKFYKQAKLCFGDHIAQKFEIRKQDYNNGLTAYQDDCVQIVKIFGHMEQNSPKLIDQETIFLLSNPMLKQKEQMGEFFEKILQEYIMKANLTVPYVNLTLKLFIQYPKSTLFANFLKQIDEQKLQLQNSSKILCYKALQSDPEESSKSYLKGLIDRIFSEQTKPQNQEKTKKQTVQKKEEIVQQTEKSQTQTSKQEIEIFKTIMAPQIQMLNSVFNRQGKRKKILDRTSTWEKFKESHEELRIKHLIDRK